MTVMEPLARLMLAAIVASAGVGASAATRVLDCPLRAAPYSIGIPLTDILTNPAARAAVDGVVPGTLGTLAAPGPDTPSIFTIMTMREIAGFKRIDRATLNRIDRALAAVPVTPADARARCARYDEDRPDLRPQAGRPRLLLFEKSTGFRDTPSVNAAHAALVAMAARRGWALVATDRAGAMTPAVLRRFDAVIWNNVSGDVLTMRQRRAFEAYIARGGGYVGIHGSAGDFTYYWNWYADRLVGARFVGHPLGPQFQDARVRIEPARSGIGAASVPGWTMRDEWYSFAKSPRTTGADIVATLDETSYSPKGIMGQDLRMGDHPIAWTRCIGNGRSFYSAIGHLPETYSDPHYVGLLEDAVNWAAGGGRTTCRGSVEVPNRE